MVINLVRVQATDDDYAFALAEAEQGDSADDIVGALAGRGLDKEAAGRVVRRVLRHRAEAHRKAATRTLAVGFAWFAGGVALTIFGEYNAALRGSGTYRIFWGAILVGGSQLLQGVCRLLFYGPRDPNAKPRANFLERYAGRGMLLGLAGGAIVGGVWGYAASSHAVGPWGDALAGALLGPIPGLAAGGLLGALYAAVAHLRGRS